MQVKRYEVNRIDEAMQKIKQDLGPDAVILSARRIKGAKSLEVMAAVDRMQSTKATSATEGNIGCPDVLTRSQSAERPTECRKDIELFFSELRHDFQTLFEFLGVKGHYRDLGPYVPVYETLISKGIASRSVLSLIKTLKEDAVKNGYPDGCNTWIHLKKIMQQSIEPVFSGQREKRIRAFIGPSGEGKTTTLAKIAAKAIYGDKKKVGIVTTDTYRIGAIGQLKIYADIMNIPLEIVKEDREFRKTVEKFSDKDLVLVDTPGAGRNDMKQCMKIKALMTGEHPVDTALVLSATASCDTMTNAAVRFGAAGYDHIIFTKLDDAGSYGSLYNIMEYACKPVSHIADGQRVPQDIEEMNAFKFVRLVMEEQMH
ncbi:MAG: flagellar biosynthesis protein FlhF [Syntrophales bacterium]|jgi:flagellar biosynthesis protein FlhF|nr:flagellar biosynthesis protein FlhF [Syntrophales bacterium]MDY0043119.1 flagellar biosynthesis protein FlhF [Syntrophales bacterium]